MLERLCHEQLIKNHQQGGKKQNTHYYQYTRICWFLKQRKKETENNIFSVPGAPGFQSKERKQKQLEVLSASFDLSSINR